MAEAVLHTNKISGRRKQLLPTSTLGMTIFVLTELMFFTALVSAYLVIKSGSATWAPPEGVALPIYTTGLNTLVLLVSGAYLFLARRYLKTKGYISAKSAYLRAVMLGIVFVAVQGYEWVNLIGWGMTMNSSVFGATFFLLIGTHGLHALAAVLAMAYHVAKKWNTGLTDEHFFTMQIFWFFIVGMWPILYGLVYFN